MSTSDAHVEFDQALALARAFGARAADRLEHIVGCPTCRERVADVRAIERAIGPDGAMREGFVDEVLATLPTVGPPPAARAAWGLVNGGLTYAAAVCFLVSADAGGGAAAVAGVSLVAALGVLVATILPRKVASPG